MIGLVIKYMEKTERRVPLLETETKKHLPPYVMLMLVAIVMAFAIAGVYSLTKDTIEEAAVQAQAAARSMVMENAASMEELALEENAPVDYCYAAYDAEGELIGYVSQITAVGFGGEIEVTVGMDTEGAITAIHVGGKDFSETSGLGAKTRDAAFTDQFKGMSGLLVLKQNVDSVTGASVSSGAVVSGVNRALSYMTELLPEDPDAETEELLLPEEDLAELLPGAESVEWMGGGAGIDGWWQADSGYILRATGYGEGPIVVTMGFDNDRTVTDLIIGDENFMETEGRGDGVLADWYREQFIGRSGLQSYGAGVDAISGATVTSNATLSAINACMGFDPSSPDTAAEEIPEERTDEPSEEPVPDMVTEASVTEDSPEQIGQAETPSAVLPTPDANTEASPLFEPPVPTAVPAQSAQTVIAPIPSFPVPAITPGASAEASPPLPESMPDAVREASVTE